jgi:FKBP-type peptidyl-prolyl cis-trans isomerase 2
MEEAVVGMQIGQTRTVTIQPRDAFGEHRDGMLITVDKERVQAGLAPEIGQRVWATCASGRKMSVTVVEISGTKVTLDTNHPLAGKVITFEVHLVGIL